MATVTYYAQMNDYQWVPDLFEPGDRTLINTNAPNKISWTNPDGTKVELIGTGLTFDGGEPTDGTITSIRVTDSAGNLLYRVTGLSEDAQTLFFWAFGYDRDDGRHEDANGFNFIQDILQGNDVITGSDESDDIFGGRSNSNDTINAAGGDDYIHGDGGNDSINGGDGWDTLSYDESFYDPFAFQGIAVNMVAGTITDCWGGSDTIQNIEEVIGSKFRDTMTGNDLDNAFNGLRGADTMIGGGGNGYDELYYHRDARFGGHRGINADLVAGTVRDGFGNLDTISGFERIIGTKYDDRFRGDGGNNHFQGQAGVDTYNGGAGADRVIFRFWEGQTQGATVDLRKASGQVINDGYGNVETLVSIEQLEGTDFTDRFTGDANGNYLRGRGGNDIMSGGGGDDELKGSQGADKLTGGTGSDKFVYDDDGGSGVGSFGDTITDFVSGTDKIAFWTPAFDGMDGTLRFRNGNSANQAGSSFFFKSSDSSLYWDQDGTGAIAAIKVATLTGVTAMAAGDFELWV
jgi:Ca2+-binding RTX toxin-like protein